MHQHAGEEIIRVLSGELVVRVGDERRTCRQVVPASA
jgi:quercetin dioxygenase-like cupin family protein